MRKLKMIMLPIIFIILINSGCESTKSKDAISNNPINENDMIIEVNEKDFLKVSEDEVLAYFNENKNDFISLANYQLENEMEFGTRPVIINGDEEIKKIQNQSIKKIAESFIQQGMVKNIDSLNDEIKDVHFLIDNEYGIFEQGIRYVSDRKIIDEDKTKYNHVKHYEDLGNGWFYYVHHYNKIKEEKDFREIAWSKLSEGEKKSVVIENNKAIVSMEDGKNIGYKLDEKERKFVVSVQYNTDIDGLLGPILMYFDPSTKELVGYNLRL